MIKLPDDVLKAIADLHSQLVLCNRLNFCSDSLYNLEQTLIRNATAQPVSDGWVKCSDRMPVQHQSNRYVPLSLLLNERTVVQGGFDDGEFWKNGVVINNVTRWMPLPAAPGGQDDET